MNILVVGRHKEILDTVLRLLSKRESWMAAGALTDEDAIRIFNEQNFGLVLIGGGVDETSEENLTKQFRKKDPSIKVIQHFGGGSGLLYNEIEEAIRKQP